MTLKLRCSFCDRSQNSVRTLFKGVTQPDLMSTAYICDDCVRRCHESLMHDRAPWEGDAEPEEQPVATDGGVSSPELVGTDVETHDDADEARDEAEVSFGDESVTVEGAISAPTPCHEAAVKSAEYSEADDEFRVTMTTEAADSDGFCAQVVTGIEYALEATFDGGTPIHVTVRHETPGGETTTVAEDSRR